MGKSNQITRKIDPVAGSKRAQWTEVHNTARQVIPDIYYSFTEEGQTCTVIAALLIQLVGMASCIGYTKLKNSSGKTQTSPNNIL